MSIRNLSHDRWFVRVRARYEGKMLCRKQVVTGTRQDARKVEMQFRDELVEGKKERSLTLRNFGEALSYFQQHSDANLRKSETYLNRLSRDLGPVSLSHLTERFSEYWKLLKDERAQRSGEILSPVTRNHLLMLGKTALNLCMKRGLIRSNPLSCFDKLPEESRDRVLTPEETTRIIEVMERRRSYLLMPFLFSLRNPIRSGDLKRLTRDNLDRFKPWVHFYASKTRKRKNRETCLPFLDEKLLGWFKALPAECNFLFPRIDRKERWHPLNDFKNHWRDILIAARVKDLVWHDLKHCAITWMLDNGYTERDLKNLGIQYSPAMIDRYYHIDADKVLVKWKTARKNEVVAPECGTFTGKTVNFA